MKKAHPRKKVNIRKSPFTLLEVLIAFFLISIAILPLVYTQTFTYQQHKRFIREIDLDRIANLIFVDILERLHKKENISWQDLQSGRVIPIEQEFPHVSGNYYFLTHHAKANEDQTYVVVDYTLKINLQIPDSEKIYSFDFDLLATWNATEVQPPSQDER